MENVFLSFAGNPSFVENGSFPGMSYFLRSIRIFLILFYPLLRLFYSAVICFVVKPIPVVVFFH